MGRKNNNAREAVSPKYVDAMIRRIQREDAVYKAHKRKEEFSMKEFSMSYSEWLDSKERLSK